MTGGRARVAAAAALGGLVGAAVGSCGGSGTATGGGAVGTAGAKAVIAAMRAAEAVRAPWRCARLVPEAAKTVSDTFETAGKHWRVEGDTLRGDGSGPLRMGLVADARGGGDATRVALVGLGPLLRRAAVDLVIAVGGMGTTEAELVRTLEPLTGPWPVVAIPGDRESLPALRGAVALLRSRGAAIVDGSAVRFVEAGGAVMATLPGLPYHERLAAGADGCQHDDADAAAVLDALDARAPAAKAGRPPRILVTPRAPRTGGASDLAIGGIHVGDVGLARALGESPIDLVVHGPVTDRLAPAGAVAHGPVVLAAGDLDAGPRFDERGARVPPAALVVTIDRRALAWQPLVAPAAPP